MRVFRSLLAIALATATFSPAMAQDAPYFRLGLGGTSISIGEEPPDVGSNNGPLQIFWSNEIPEQVAQGDSYSGDMTIAGGSNPYVVTPGGSLPAGVTPGAPIDDVRHFSGTFSTPGSYTFSYGVVDDEGESASYSRTVVVNASMFLSTSKLLYRKNVAASAYPTVGNGTGSVTYTLTGGTPPAGLNYLANGTPTGTPTGTGSGSITMQVSDSGGHQTTATIPWQVYDDLALVAPTTTTFIADINASSSTASLTANNVIGSVQWSLQSGTLPPGMSINSSSGAITGTPTAVGSYANIVLVGRDTADNRTVQTPPFTVNVEASIIEVYRNGSAPIVDLTGYDSIEIGFESFCGIKSTDLYCWGANASGQLGVGDRSSHSTPTLVGTGYQSVSLTNTHACALKTNGQVWCWGQNSNYELGLNNTTDRLTPALVGGGYTDVSAHQGGACGVQAAGLQCWGSRGGIATGGEWHFPTQLTEFLGFTKFSSAGSAKCGLKGNQAYCWGYGGTNGSTSGLTSMGGGFADISVGGAYVCGLMTTNEATCWGANNVHGELGLGNTSPRYSPGYVFNGSGLTSISTGVYGACGLKANGEAWCWGLYNNSLVAAHMATDRKFSKIFMGISNYVYGTKL